MKIRASTKISIGFIVFLAAVFGGRWLYGEYRFGGVHFAPLAPKNVNLVGVDTRAGYYVIVANQVAQLVLGQQPGFAAPEESSRTEETGAKKRIPIREMLQALQGNARALSRFIMVLNEKSDEDFPPYPVIWKAEDLMRALDGDVVLRKKLVRDLNIELDGTPLSVAIPQSLSDGIVLDCPVEITAHRRSVTGDLETVKLVGRLQEPYKPTFCIDVYNHYKTKDATPAMIAGYYRDEAQKIADGISQKQNIRGILKSRIDPSRLRQFAELPERLLNSIQIILNDDQFEGAEYSSRHTPSSNQTTYDLRIRLTPEGKNRLWRYSRGKVGTQLLLIWNGIAVAAPRIDHELAESEVTITQLGEERLVKDTVEAINGGHGAKR